MKSTLISCSLMLLFTIAIWAQPQEVVDAASLHSAIESKKSDQVQQMIKSGIDVNYQYNGRNALHVACKTGMVNMVNLIVAAGADVNSISDDGNGFTSLQLCTWGSGFKKSIKVIELLLELGADPNLAPDGNNYPIFYTIDNMDLKTLELILAHGAARDVKDSDGHTPVQLVSMKLKDPDTDVKSKQVYVDMKKTLLR